MHSKDERLRLLLAMHLPTTGKVEGPGVKIEPRQFANNFGNDLVLQ